MPELAAYTTATEFGGGQSTGNYGEGAYGAGLYGEGAGTSAAQLDPNNSALAAIENTPTLAVIT